MSPALRGPNRMMIARTEAPLRQLENERGGTVLPAIAQPVHLLQAAAETGDNMKVDLLSTAGYR
ncbi:hypothetical protein [Kocuria sp. KH4]